MRVLSGNTCQKNVGKPHIVGRLLKLAFWAERSMCGNYAALTSHGTLEHELATSGCAHRGGTRLTTPKEGMQTGGGENLRQGTCVATVQRRTHPHDYGITTNRERGALPLSSATMTKLGVAGESRMAATAPLTISDE
jgi:hypothetical protein